jgi:hypothetical protein
MFVEMSAAAAAAKSLKQSFPTAAQSLSFAVPAAAGPGFAAWCAALDGKAAADSHC